MRVVCLVGPTGAGKSGAALRLAEHLGAEILSCDSVAVYRELDIGAAKPSPEERARLPHHGIDVVAPTGTYSAARWAAMADEAARQITERGRTVLVVGGTNLYLRAWLSGLAPTPPADPALRARYGAMPVEALYARLCESDPATAAALGPADRLRISRALEVQAQVGVPVSEWRKAHAGPPRHDALLLALDPPRAELRERIGARVEAMMAAGLLGEVRGLRERYGTGLRSLSSLGYRQLGAHLEGTLSLEQAVEEIKRDTRHLARRQRVWLRGEARRGVRVLWYPTAQALPEELAARFLAGHEEASVREEASIDGHRG